MSGARFPSLPLHITPPHSLPADTLHSTHKISALCSPHAPHQPAAKPLNNKNNKKQDIVVGRGPSPPTGYQLVVNYIAMTPNGRIFDSSLDRGAPFDIRVGTGQVVAGLDEGLRTMQTGGLRRLYVPGPLSFPKGLKAAAGRPAVPAASPVMFDVQLIYVPGLDVDDE